MIYCKSDCSDTSSDHWFLVIVEFDGLMIQWKGLELVIKEKVDGLICELEC